MSSTTSQEQISAAMAYEELFVPAIFRQWARRVLDAAGVQTGDRVLDVACGTGILAREAAERMGSSEAIVGLDLAAGMLAVAERLAPSIEWHQGSAEHIPFPDGSFDAVVSQFGLMFFTDRVKALREMHRVLAPGGRLAIAVWDSLDRIPALAKELAILERIAGSEAAEPLRAPFVLGDPESLRALAREAEIDSADVTTHEGTARFRSIRTLVEADLRGWLPLMGVNLPEDQIVEILDEADKELSEYSTTDGMMVFDMPAHIIIGTK